MNSDHSIDIQPQPAPSPPVRKGRFPWRIGWRLVYTLLLLALLVLLNIFWGSSAGARIRQQSTGTPLVLAFYYTWFDQNTWSEDKVPDFPVERYISADRAVMGRHIEQAQRAGIDALIVAWYGPTGQWNQTEPNLTAMLDEANARGFKIGILFETNSPFFSGIGDGTAALSHALSVHTNHPAYLRVDGKPVIFFWRPTIWGVESWRGIRNQVDPGRNSIWISEGVDTSYLAVFDGHHLYSNTWNPPSDLNTTNQKFARLVNSARQNLGSYKYWVATVMPGYNDLRTGRGNAFAKDREGGAYYERSWQAAIGSSPDWIVITSFNEWPEGSYIEPSVAYGDHYLNLTTRWSQQYKAGGGAPPPPPVQQVQAVPPQVVVAAPEPTEPTGYVTTLLLNLRAGPGTGYPILAGMSQGVALSVIGRNSTAGNWWQVSYQGQLGWASGDYLRLAGPMDSVPTVDLPLPPTAQANSSRQTGQSSLVYELLLGEKSNLIDEERRAKLIQKWIPSTEPD
jgi:hypothetical protein